MSNVMSSPSLTRRSFLKTTGAIAGASALVGGCTSLLSARQAQADAEAGEEVRYGFCHGNCICGCRLKYTVRDGVVVKSEMAPYPGDERYNRICSKGLSHAQRTYSPKRLMYPMRRVEGTERGAGQWERITWDEAIEEITTKWKGYMEEYGSGSIGFSNSGGNCNSCGVYAYQNTISAMLGWTTIPNQADQAGVQTYANWVGIGMVFAGNEIADIVNAKKVFIWGNNPAISSIQSTSFVWDAKEHGTKFIALDPNHSPSVAAFADEWYRPRIATDAALFMGMCHVVIDEGLIDEDFLKANTVAPFLVKKSDGLFLRQKDLDGGSADASDDDYYSSILVADASGKPVLASEERNPKLSGVKEANGIKVSTAYDLLIERLDEWPIDRCAEICDIDEETIAKLAREFADGPTTTMMHWAPDHYYNGHTGFEGLITLHALTGNLAKPGTGITQNGNIASLPVAGAANWIASHGGSGGGLDASGNSANGVNLSAVQLREYFETGGKINGKDVGITLKSWFSTGMNCVGGTANRTDVLEAIKHIDFIVKADITWTETADYADIVLPVSYYTEYEDLCGATAWNAPYLVHAEQCIDPMYEGKTDFEIFNLLLEGLGRQDIACGSLEDWLRFTLDESQVMSSQGITLDTMREEHVVRPVFGEDGGPLVGGIGTPTGRVEFYQETPRSNNMWPGDYDVDEERMVHWEPPLEAWPVTAGGFEQSEVSKKYPLNMLWTRSRFATHTSFGMGSHWLDEIDPEPYIHMNPEDAASRGLSNGDMVRVYNDRGYCVIKMYCDAGLRPGIINTPQRYQATNCGQYREGSMLDLPNATQHPFILSANFHEAMVEVEKYKEA